MGMCEKIKVDRVLADEIFILHDTIGPIDLGFPVPEGSVLTGEIEVTVLECDPVFDEEEGIVGVELEVMVQKDFTITDPEDEEELPLEFAFRRTLRTRFHGLTLRDLEGVELRRVKCQIFDLRSVNGEITFICANPDFDGNAAIEETLIVTIKVKLAIEEQIIVALCPPGHRRVIQVEETCE